MSLNQPLLLSSALVHQMLLNSDLSIQTSAFGSQSGGGWVKRTLLRGHEKRGEVMGIWHR